MSWSWMSPIPKYSWPVQAEYLVICTNVFFFSCSLSSDLLVFLHSFCWFTQITLPQETYSACKGSSRYYDKVLGLQSAYCQPHKWSNQKQIRGLNWLRTYHFVVGFHPFLTGRTHLNHSYTTDSFWAPFYIIFARFHHLIVPNKIFLKGELTGFQKHARCQARCERFSN